MQRSWNSAIWIGALVALAGIFCYPLIFLRVPALRDRPWFTLPLIAFGLVLIAVGLARAFRQPQLYRGKVFGSVLGVLTFAIAVLFCYAVFVGARNLPVSPRAPQVGQSAPDFTLPDSKNTPVNLTQILNSPFAPNGAAASGAGATAGVLLIFYRGYW
jgi:hypothetical protein